MKKQNAWYSQGAYLQKWALVGNLRRKQTTMLVVFKGPQITRTVMLPSLQHVQSRIKEYFSKWHQKLSMTTRLKFKIINIFVVCILQTTKLAASGNRYIMRLRTWQAVSVVRYVQKIAPVGLSCRNCFFRCFALILGWIIRVLWGSNFPTPSSHVSGY